ncbi:MAG: CHAD domain-containing protein [Methanoregula sp.]|uniref:CHAD domain-containing protein n=1 Tax=Methanoregula sp. TaxID=2052170 RepID=UPI003BB20826
MQVPDPIPAISGSCTFGMGRLLPLIDAFSKEIAGVREAKDIEHVHRMRVASRRLRAALPLFSSCFAEKDYRRWMRQIRKITRALGAARDNDVQVAFLKKYLKTQAMPAPSGTTSTPGNQADAGNPLTALLTRYQKQRGVYQKNVIVVLDELEHSQMILQLQSACLALEQQSPIKNRERYEGILPIAAERIGRRLQEVYRFEPFVHNPDAVFEHHALRIATKKLRYTLETYAPLFRRDLKKPIGRIKKLQDLLGDIHDCDVWIEHMSLAIVKQRARRTPLDSLPALSVSAISPLRKLLINREKRRALLYRQCVRYWDSLVHSGFWNNLQSQVLSGQRSAFINRRTLPAKEERNAFEQLAAGVPDHAAHAQTVRVLALRLFDTLKPLHCLSRRDRALLSYAAMVHDIGCNTVQSGHQKKSAELILTCASLPVQVREQGIIAIIARLHSGNVHTRPKGFFVLLSPDDQKRALVLATLLRVADGLDYLHAGSVTGLTCVIRETDILCTLTTTNDAETEKARAVRKSDLFTEVFKKVLVVM